MEQTLVQMVDLVAQMLQALTGKLLNVNGEDVEAKTVSSDDGGGRRTAPKPILESRRSIGS